MALSKTLRTIQASASNTTGSTTTGTAVNLTSAYGATVTAKITNGGTGPTVACSAYLETSADNSAWKVRRIGTGSLTASDVREFQWDLPASVMYARVRFTGNTAQTVTVEAFLQELTTL